MALELRGRQDLTQNCDCILRSETEPPHQGESQGREGSHKIASDFPITSACYSSKTMTSQEPCSRDSASMPAASSDQEIAQGVQSLKALSLNGLNPNLSHFASASEDSQLMSSGVKGRPHPILSWGDVTEISNGERAKTQEYLKHPIAGSSSSSDPWQVRSTQNPSRPLVRRPTPVAIRVPKSVLGKGSSKMMAASVEEEEEEEEDEEWVVGDGEESPVSVSLKQGTNADVLVIEDIESSDVESPSPGLSTPKDLQLGLAVEGHTIERNTDVGSPTIVVQTDIGVELSQKEAEQLEDADEDEEEEEEEDNFDVGDKQFLSPTASKSFEKNPEPVASNTRAQSVPHQPRKFVRRQTPITLDLPKNLKEYMVAPSNEGIMEEEEEEDEDNRTSECGQQRSKAAQATNIQADDAQASMDNISSSDKPAETENTVDANTNAVGEETTKSDTVAQVSVSDRPDIITSVNSNNNNREAPSFDLVEAAQDTVKSQVRRNLQSGGKQEMGPPTSQRQCLFKKSATSGTKDGSGSPSSTRRKVSAHHTKILQRQLTPLEIEVPKHVISDAMKKRTTDAFLEEDES